MEDGAISYCPNIHLASYEHQKFNMLTDMTDRTAIDTIKGYFYQFDYTIAQLLELENDTDTTIVEGIEDVDIKTATDETAIQCKYYAKTEYNHSVIGRPIRLMLDHYKLVSTGTKKRIRYKLYGHFQSGQSKLVLPIDPIFLKNNFLTYSENKVKHFHHVELGLTDVALADFLSLLTIDILALEYLSQMSKISTLLMAQFECNAFEAEHFFYNNALKVIKEIAVEENEADRTISKSDFLRKINFRRILFNEWFIKYKGQNRLFADLRSQYFTHLNISPFERFFIIEVPTVNYLRSELKDLLFEISKKWSKFSPREPNPFCPYVYLHNISQEELIALKNELHIEGFMFIDGFDFEGAAFSQKSIIKAINNTQPTKLKILNAISFLELTINEITKTKEIYQFYTSNIFFDVSYENIKRIDIQFNQLSDIKKII